MTATRDRQSDPEADELLVPWDERSVVGSARGLPWWGAVLLGFTLAVLGAFVNEKIQGHLGLLFYLCYVFGAVGAVCWVQRRGLFGPMVQPPLVLAVTVPAVLLFASNLPANSDTLTKALEIGTPLINAFPTMAFCTAVTVLIGVIRVYRERDPYKARAAAKAKDGDGVDSPVSDRGGPVRRRDGGTTPPSPGRRRGSGGSAAGGRTAQRGRSTGEGGPQRPRDPDLPPSRGGRKPPEPGARGPRQPRAPRAEPPPGESQPGRCRRAPRPDNPRSDGIDGPRPEPGRRLPPPRRRPWHDES